MLKDSREQASTPPAAERQRTLPMRKVLREQLNACFPLDSDLDAFTLDWFPEIYRQFARGMIRTEKLNLLLGLGQTLDDLQKALATEWALRAQPTLVTMPAATLVSAPRPRRGQQEQEIIIEDDFHALSTDKLAAWMRTIKRLIGKELTVILRNCRAGSVILTLRADWRALRLLHGEFAAGRLRSLNGYRVLDVRWRELPRHGSVYRSLLQSLRVRQLALYLVVGGLQLDLGRLSSRLRAPRWAVAVVLWFVLSGVAWATQQVARVIAHRLSVPARGEPPRDTETSTKKPKPGHHHGARRPDSEPPPAGFSSPEEPAPAPDVDALSPSTLVLHHELPPSHARPRPQPQPEAATDDNAAAVDQTLSNAQTAYVNGNFHLAISLSSSVQRLNPTRAWRIIGAAACNLKDVKLASEAFRHLDPASQQYLIYTCQRQNITSSKGSKFRLGPP
jgi:hypothetical protein